MPPRHHSILVPPYGMGTTLPHGCHMAGYQHFHIDTVSAVGCRQLSDSVGLTGCNAVALPAALLSPRPAGGKPLSSTPSLQSPKTPCDMLYWMAGVAAWQEVVSAAAMLLIT